MGIADWLGTMGKRGTLAEKRARKEQMHAGGRGEASAAKAARKAEKATEAEKAATQRSKADKNR